MCTIACDVFVQDHPKISCSREECFSLSVGLFHFALFLVTHPPSPFPPSAPVLSLRSVCVCRSGLWMTNVFVQDHPKISCSREDCFSLSVGLFHFALFGLRSLLHRSRLRRPYYSRSACVLQRLARRVFLAFRQLISLCFILSYAPSFTVPAFGARIILGLLVCVAAVYG